MPNKIWAILGIVLALSALVAGAIAYDKWRISTSYDHGYSTCTADNLLAVNKAVEEDRKAEKLKQGKIDEETKKQFDAQRRINRNLINDLSKLRERASRKQQTDKSKLVCEGASGADLSAEDAGFLTREAARADEIRTGLKACYNFADTLSPD